MSSYHQNLYIVIGGVETQIQASATGTIDVDTSQYVSSMYQAIPSDKYLDGTFKVYTYDSNNTLVGTSTTPYRANVVNSNPTFDIAYEDNNATTVAITNNNQQIIQGKSTCKFKFTNIDTKNYSNPYSFSITINGETRSNITVEAGDAYTELTKANFTINDSYYHEDSDFTLDVQGSVDNTTVGDYCHINCGAIIKSNTTVENKTKVDYGEIV